jgi:hypothetical protein
LALCSRPFEEHRMYVPSTLERDVRSSPGNREDHANARSSRYPRFSVPCFLHCRVNIP